MGRHYSAQGRNVNIFALVHENKMRKLGVREATQIVGCDVGFEPHPFDFREMERSHSEGVGPWLHKPMRPSPVLSLTWGTLWFSDNKLLSSWIPHWTFLPLEAQSIGPSASIGGPKP